ncbi:MAG: hypothetical protein HY951_04490 [Bacteroidia bacterium]|nr:hypothetical protein [Bacteroidia bacterium]
MSETKGGDCSDGLYWGGDCTWVNAPLVKSPLKNSNLPTNPNCVLLLK